MKKYYYVSLFVGLVALANLNNAQATPLYYTFEGVVSDDPHFTRYDSAGSFYDLTGLSVNDPISYVFLVDDEVGVHTVTENFGGWGHEWHHLNYHTELVSGTGLVVGDNSSGSFRAYIDFDQQGESDQGDFTISGTASNGYFSMYSYCYNGEIPREAMDSNTNFTQWAVGHLDSIDNTLVIEKDNLQSAFQLSVELTSISETLPNSSVPEPSTFLLMGIGLISIGATRIRKLLT
ncbi:MAG: PEP-CTERM sorting domain-containing protein [Candidatus Thiodiazotropha sp.]|jgi:hypothetical protein